MADQVRGTEDDEEIMPRGDDDEEEPSVEVYNNTTNNTTACVTTEEDLVYGSGGESGTATLDNDDLNGNNSSSQSSLNKWHHNGFGDAVAKQTGKFSREESDIIKTAIEDYCHRKQISVKSLCSEREHKADLKGAWMEIARYLPHRSVQSVYRHGIRQCHPFKRGAWSEAEVSMLQDLVAHNSKKWAMIQTKLNRSADSCRDKYREMSDDFVKGRWEDVETAELVSQIRCWLHHHTNGATSTLVDFFELAQLVEEMKIQIPWSLISKRMGRRSRLSCFKKWQKLTSEQEFRSLSAGASPTTDNNNNSTEAAAVVETMAATAAVTLEEQRPIKRQKTEQVPQEELLDVVQVDHDIIPQVAAEEYIVPMTDAHVAEAELAAETVEALGLPDLIASKT